MFDWYLKIMSMKYADFSGRASRTEYWMFALAVFLVYMLMGVLFVASIALTSTTHKDGLSVVALFLMCLFSLLLLGHIVPSLACGVRRLHDVNLSGWFVLLGFVPLGGLIMLILHCLDSTPGPNRYGLGPDTL